MANRYWVSAGTGNWDASDTSRWSASSGGATGASAPTASDDVFFDANSGGGSSYCTISGTASCRSLNCSGDTGSSNYIGTISMGSGTINIGDGTAGASNVALKFVNTMSFPGSAGAINFVSTSATQQTITTTGHVQPNTTINAAGGSYIFGDNYTMSSSRTLTLTAGSLDAGNYNVSIGKLVSSNSNTRSLTMGSGTWDLTSASGTLWSSVVNTNLTLNAGTSTILVSDVGSSLKILQFNASNTYNNVNISGGGSGVVQLSQSSNINNLTIGAPKSIIFSSTRTITINNTLTMTGSAGNLITITSSVGGSPFALSKSSGIVSCNYLSLQDSTATGGATWYAGANSTNVSGNSGWIFSAAPSANFFQLFP